MQVARADDKELSGLLAQFVCVRVVQMKGVDLSLFQFDYDQTWAVFFLNADKTVYGRYGTRSTDRATADRDVSIEGFKEALQGALQVHAGYPANKASLAGKTGPEAKTRVPERFSALQGPRYAKPLPDGCIHCHNVWEGVRADTRPSGKPVSDEWLWVYPMPDALGLTLDGRSRATVTAVAAGSAASKAGFQAKDRIVAMEGQPILSVADVQWVLERAKVPTDLKVEVERGAAGGRETLSLHLAEGWRRAGDLSWRESTWNLRPGMRVDAMTDAERRKLGGSKGAVGLRVRFAGPNGAAAKAGLRANDEIVAIDGLTAPMTETEFLAYLYQRKRSGEDVELLVAHGVKRQKVSLKAP